MDHKFIQIACTKVEIYALDDQGGVWEYASVQRWVTDDGEPLEGWINGANSQRAHYWSPLASDRKWVGWPPSAREEAEREIETFLG